MNFVIGDVSEAFVIEAKRIRADRDKQYSNIFREERSDLRWVGEIGELCFHGWAQRNTSLPVKWIVEEAAGKADFKIGITSVGMKTVKRKVPIRPHYTAQITAKHAEEPVDHYFFASYEYPVNRLWLLGGIKKTDFLRKAKSYEGGAEVHDNYKIRKGHKIYNVDISELIPPVEWLSTLQ